MNISPTRELDINLIRIDGGTQARAEINQTVVDQYAECIDSLPPIIVFFDGVKYWLVDGFHRYFAHLKDKREKIQASVRSGTQRAAVLASLEQNASHGLQRTSEDKRKSVNTMLVDREWAMWSDREIADHCRVSHTYVANVRRAQKEGGNVATPTTKNLPKEVREQVKEIREAGGTPRLMQQGEKTVAFDAAKKTPAVNQHTAKKEEPETPAVPQEPGKPWGGFEETMRGYVSQLRSIALAMGKTLGYNSDNKQVTNKWAKFISYGGTVGQINAAIRAVEDGLPAEISASDPSDYVSYHKLKIDKQLSPKKPAA